MAGLGLRSKARDRRQTLTPRKKRQRAAPVGQSLQPRQDELGPRIFVEEAKIELTPNLNSTKNRSGLTSSSTIS